MAILRALNGILEIDGILKYKIPSREAGLIFILRHKNYNHQKVTKFK
jgi:hypothetical protein